MKTKANRAPLFNPDSVAAKIQSLLLEDLSNVPSIDPRYMDAFLASQQTAGVKKYLSISSEADSGMRRKNAIDRFLSVNGHLLRYNKSTLFPDGSLCRKDREIDPRTMILLRARSIAYQALGDFDYEVFFSLCKHGPNTSLGVKYIDSGNSAKWQFPLTITEACIPLIDLYYRWDLTLAEMLQRSNPLADFRFGLRPHLRVLKSSRLTTVPKNEDTDRTIAIEPTLNMFFQQGLGSYIAEKLLVFGVDIQSQQEVHREMALRASITRQFGTIDFSSASDCVSNELLRYLLPPIWYRFVDQCRTESTSIDGEVVDLNCFATMGNATTFVLETLVFLSLAHACMSTQYDRTRSRFPEWESFKDLISVFGDDCIVPSDIADVFIDICEHVGFIVNKEKSFTDPACDFRESCGGDYKSGRNIRAFYLKSPRSTAPSVLRSWLYIQWNGLLKSFIVKLGDHSYVYRSQALRYVAQLISAHNKEIYRVQDTDPEDSGLKTYGDWNRQKFLFHVRCAPIFVDRNASIHYRKLTSALTLGGSVTPELEYWRALKFPVISARTHFSNPFKVLKRDRGYVVTSSISFDRGAFAS